jgi:hypothetical protein
MNYSIEIPIYVENKDEEEFEWKDLEVVFDFDNEGYSITGYFLDGEQVNYNDIKKLNMALEMRINTSIENFIINTEHNDEY